MEAVTLDQGGVFFLYGFDGTGKTHLWKILSAVIRSKGQIVLNVASSGIAALLLPAGRTAHSRFGIPLNPDELSTCNMHPGSDLAALVAEASLIIWDEAPMMSKFCFESLDRSMRDVIPRHKDKLFGGKVVVFGGDFRQVLPVITGGGREDITRASLCSSYLWDEYIDASVAEEIKSFSEWILRVGDGFEEQNDPNFFQESAILCPTNDDVCAINDYMMSALRGEERVYLSSDSIDPSDTSNHDSSVYTPDFLNNIKISGLPNHCIKLRVGAPVMLLRNIDPNSGLCNGTRLQVTQLADHIIEAIVLTGHTLGQKVYIPRLSVSPPEGKFPFRMRRRQFPLMVSFAMTINKSQGQTLSGVGLYLPRPVFSHGQLYVALSRVKSKAGVKVLIVDKEGNPQKQTMNVVFKEIFQKLIK
ncbi:ATP-dependent DNA helicase PIF1-like [Eutrema salsugineum]|uniref:ATP-dependent DNA helicase PIF1-like n=1 Tax=Eutrema salsugineum TaxID=72664 RepID=UPI000CED13E8|nr:ATP-dependent DNA helicase PIF1-like [Eutrema salsugineum]